MVTLVGFLGELKCQLISLRRNRQVFRPLPSGCAGSSPRRAISKTRREAMRKNAAIVCSSTNGSKPSKRLFGSTAGFGEIGTTKGLDSKVNLNFSWFSLVGAPSPARCNRCPRLFCAPFYARIGSRAGPSRPYPSSSAPGSVRQAGVPMRLPSGSARETNTVQRVHLVRAEQCDACTSRL